LSPRLRAPFALALGLLLAPLARGQEEAAQREALLRAFRAVEDPKAQGFADLEAVATELRALHGRAGSLPAGKRERTRFFIAVREAEVRLRQGRLEEAGRLGLAARAQAQADQVYGGGYRAQLLVLLEQCLDAPGFRKLLVEERAFLADPAATAEAEWLALPLALLQAQLALLDGHDARGMALLEDCAERALRELPREDPWRQKCLGRLAWEFVVRQDLGRAEVYLKELPPTLAAYPRGLVALRRGDHELALRAGKALERGGRAVHGLLLQGEAHELAGRIDEARAAYAKLKESAREPLDRAIALRSLGDCELASGSLDGKAAELLYREALALLRGDRHAAAERVQVAARLGDALARQGRRDDARDAYRASLAEVDAARRGAVSDLFGASWLVDESLRAIEGTLGIWNSGAGDAYDALAVLEIGKARTLLDWAVQPPQTGDEAGLTGAVREVVLGEDPAAIDAQLRALEDARRRSGARSTAEARPLGADELREAFGRDEDTVVVSYWLGEREAFVVATVGPLGLVLPLGPTAQLLPLLASAREVVTSPEIDEPWPALDAAATAFLPPMLQNALRGARRVVFCPDDRLWLLPFEALRIAGRPLGLTHAVERAASLSLRAQLAARVPHGRGLALVDSVAAPDDESRFALAPLRYSAREGELVAEAYGGARGRLQGSAATRDALAALLAPADFDVVHVSAHAVLDRRVPTASLLVLADGPTALPSLIGIPLDGALLVLAACSSANGEARSGEGELGLLGWPVAAGARGAVASLWPINQQAGSDLMAQFHAFRAECRDSAEAMRRAREVLAAAPNYAHPRYWAGFGVFCAERDGAGGGFLSARLGLLSLCGVAALLLAIGVAARARRGR
jgi:hypothetical protein